MTIRKLLFILFLYVLLVGIFSYVAYLSSPDDPKRSVQTALLWTAGGVAVLLLALILERVIGWRRARRAERIAQPAAANVGKTVHEHDAALASLLREADERLAQAPVEKGARPWRVRDLPLHLIVGPERGGKTAIVHNCGLELSLLAGQVAGGESIVPTQVANLWLGHQSVLCEVGGVVFASDPDRLAGFLRVLKSSGGAPGWLSRLQPSPGTRLKSVVLVYDSRAFVGTPDQSALSRSALQIKERLSAIASVFGAAFPVYVLFTNLDGAMRSEQVRYFEPFVSRIADGEAGQVLGVLSPENPPESQSRVWAEAETKRLGRLFQSIFQRLGERRLLALAQEAEPARKPAIYEFPREFKKIRGPLVQFLVDVFKPDPLNATPWIRGFFFTGTRRVERSAAPRTDAASVYLPTRSAAEATRIFDPQRHGNAMSIFSEGPQGPSAVQWMFLTEFFHKVLGLDQPSNKPIGPAGKFAAYRKIAAAAAASLAILLALIWTSSWLANMRVIRDMESAVRSVRGTQGSMDLSLTNLQTLDALRKSLEGLEGNDSLIPHWGLYSGEQLKDLGFGVYFERLKRLSLDPINRSLTAELRKPAKPGTFERLKTHRTISTVACAVDAPLISKVFMDTTAEAHPDLDGARRSLLTDQFNFYLAHLAKKEYQPVTKLPEDVPAIEIASDFLVSGGGPEEQFKALLASLRGQTKTLDVEAKVPGYREVLSGNESVPGEFTKEGRAAFEDFVSQRNSGGLETCVIGAVRSAKGAMMSSATKDKLRSLYYREYARAWREFLGSYKVKPFSSVQDAAKKLGILADTTKSPLLQVIGLVAANTNLEAAKPPEPGPIEKTVDRAVRNSSVVQANSKTSLAKEAQKLLADHDEPAMTAADVTARFQPVLYTIPDPAVLAGEHVSGYVSSLIRLKQALEDFSAAAKPDQAQIGPARTAVQQAESAQQALAGNFRNVGDEGMPGILSDLLKQPIRGASGLIPSNVDAASSRDMNGKLQQFCREMKPVLSSFPFSTNGPDANLDQIAGGFAPERGLVWQRAAKDWNAIVVRRENKWMAADTPPSGLHVDPALLSFLNRAQQFTNALYGAGGPQPKLQYTLRPASGQSSGIRLALDGTVLNSAESRLQVAFVWPGPGPNSGAEARSGSPDLKTSSGFGSFPGIWGVFRLFRIADARPLDARNVQWSESQGLGRAAPQRLDPPAKIDVVNFPGGADLFNPRFYDSLQCPTKAVSAN